jgi:hypothetical protein
MKVYWAMSDKMFFLIKDLYAIHMKVIDTVQKNQLASASGSSGGGGGSYQSPTTSSATTWNTSANDLFTRKLPLADMSFTSGCWNEQPFRYSTDEITSSHSFLFQSVGRSPSVSSPASSSRGVSSFDLWLQQQQDQKRA